MKLLGRDAAELTALADYLTAHRPALEVLAGPLPGIYSPTGPGKLLFTFFAAMAETERENMRESTLEGARHRSPQGQARPPSQPRRPGGAGGDRVRGDVGLHVVTAARGFVRTVRGATAYRSPGRAADGLSRPGGAAVGFAGDRGADGLTP
ncbi:hypothetical protein GCM10010301_32510 [Streptomyces plicatus]|nr:hypothetical protein GCM10010301_32510 [Streptomyces plicatus]